MSDEIPISKALSVKFTPYKATLIAHKMMGGSSVTAEYSRTRYRNDPQYAAKERGRKNAK